MIKKIRAIFWITWRILTKKYWFVINFNTLDDGATIWSNSRLPGKYTEEMIETNIQRISFFLSEDTKESDL